MTRSQIENSLNELNQLVLEGNAMAAFEKYYHDAVVMQENEAPPTISKESNRQRELEFFENITEFRSAEVKGIGIGDCISFVVWKYDYTHKEWGVRDYTQVSIQEWKEGKIIKEKFIYSN
ncbi:MAG TPA: hypothetical protein VK166_04210 [Chitinophagaceae bacterium]|nr:hypothetical protein [Chitinophagaceae bacterium]